MATIAEELAKLAITDTFVRNENPLAGVWKLLKPGVTKGKCSTTAPAGWTPTSTFATGPDGAYWSTGSFASSGSTYVAVKAKLARVGTGILREVGIHACRSKTETETKQNGYYLRGSHEGSAEYRWTLEKWVSGEVTVMAEVKTKTYKQNSRIALIVGNGKVQMWASKEAESAFEEVLSATDSTYTEGYSGVAGKGAGEFILSGFGTGTFEIEEEKEGKTVTVKIGGVTKKVKRWIKTAGGLKNI